MPMTVLLRCRDIEETREFYHSALGFNVRETVEATLTAEYCGGVLIFTSGDLWKSPPAFPGRSTLRSPMQTATSRLLKIRLQSLGLFRTCRTVPESSE